MPVSITSRREENTEEVQVSRAKISTVDGVQTAVSIESATLYPLMYDATTVSISGIPGLKLEDLHLEMSEAVGEERKCVSFNMATRENEGVDQWSERIFYSSELITNVETGAKEITIYIPHRSSNGQTVSGYADSVVMISLSYEGRDYYTSYRTNLPPFIINGRPVKRNPNEEDPVIPAYADRVNFGVDTVPSYYENSQRFQNNYLFTNSTPRYTITASGYLPKYLDEIYEFREIQAYMLNEKTSMKTDLPISTSSTSQNELPVMKVDGSSVPFKSQFDLTTWQYDLYSDTYSASSGTIFSTSCISGTLAEKL